MEPFDTLEKLINEHGSAAILLQRLELAKDQYADLEKKLQASEGKRAEAEAKSQRFELEALRLREKVRELEDAAQACSGQRLEPFREELLRVISEEQIVLDDQGFDRVNGNPDVIRFHLKEMKDLGLVRVGYFSDGRREWSLSHEGRKYLIEHGLIR